MRRGPRSSSRSLTAALWVNAALLGGILIAMLSRSVPAQNQAMAQQAMPPIAGGGGLFFMPGQIDANLFGVYVLDVDRQTMMVYDYFRGDKTLRLIAARDIRFDRDLRRYNTEPNPDRIAELLQGEADNARVNESGDNAARSTVEGGPDQNDSDATAPDATIPDATPDSANESPQN